MHSFGVSSKAIGGELKPTIRRNSLYADPAAEDRGAIGLTMAIERFLPTSKLTLKLSPPATHI
jgi:hypothetical protein